MPMGSANSSPSSTRYRPVSSRHSCRRNERASARGVLFDTAEQLLRELELPFQLAVVQLEHAEWLAAEGRAEQAEPLLADARETFDRLGAKPWLDRVAAGSASFVTVA